MASRTVQFSFAVCSPLPFHHGTGNESHESKGRQEVGRADTDSSHRIRGGDQWFEEQTSEGRCGCAFRGCLRRDQEERKLQACRHVELEVEEEAGHASEEGHQSIHQGALCLQSQACLQDCEGTRNEEVEGGFELNFQKFCTSMKLWWAVSPSFFTPPVQIASLRS